MCQFLNQAENLLRDQEGEKASAAPISSNIIIATTFTEVCVPLSSLSGRLLSNHVSQGKVEMLTAE